MMAAIGAVELPELVGGLAQLLQPQAPLSSLDLLLRIVSLLATPRTSNASSPWPSSALQMSIALLAMPT